MSFAESRVVALITARGGSKGIPKKNLSLLGEESLVSRAVRLSRSIRGVEVYLSTDCPEIAGEGIRCGCTVPFLRPPHLASDLATDFPVLEHFVDWYRDETLCDPDFLIHIRPTSPFRSPLDVEKGLAIILDDPDIDCVRSITRAPVTPYKMWKKTSSNKILPLLTLDNISEPYNSPRQILPDVYVQTGHFDILRVKSLRESSSVTGTRIYGYEVPSETYLDIDKPIDLLVAEASLPLIELDYK